MSNTRNGLFGKLDDFFGFLDPTKTLEPFSPYEEIFGNDEKSSKSSYSSNSYSTSYSSSSTTSSSTSNSSSIFGWD